MADELWVHVPADTRPTIYTSVRTPPAEDTLTGLGVFALEDGYPTELLEVSPRLSDLVEVPVQELLGTWPASFGDSLRRSGGRLDPAAPDRTSQRSIRYRDGTALTVVQHLTLIVPPDGTAAYGAILLFGVTDPRRPSAGQPERRSADGAAPADEAGATVPLAVAVETLGVSASTLRRWSDDGRLRTVRTAGGHRRFVIEDIRRMVRGPGPRTAPVLRAAPLPAAGPLSAIGALLEEERDALVERAISGLYEPDAKGWYATAAGTEELRRWVESIGTAATDGRGWDGALLATLHLSQHADLHGASATEGAVLLERLSDLVEFRLRTREASRPQRVAAHLLLSALGRTFLASHDGGAACPVKQADPCHHRADRRRA